MKLYINSESDFNAVFDCFHNPVGLKEIKMIFCKEHNKDIGIDYQYEAGAGKITLDACCMQFGDEIVIACRKLKADGIIPTASKVVYHLNNGLTVEIEREDDVIH